MLPEEGLRLVREYGSADRWLAVLVTLRPDGQPSVSVVNAGVLPHPVDGRPHVAFVARGNTAKLANLRRDPRATLVFRAGWEWVAVHGTAELAGPDDPRPGLGTGRLPGLDSDRRLPIEYLASFNQRVRVLARESGRILLADVHRHFHGHGRTAPEADRWYWKPNPIEPNARGASEIRRVWLETIA